MKNNKFNMLFRKFIFILFLFTFIINSHNTFSQDVTSRIPFVEISGEAKKIIEYDQVHLTYHFSAVDQNNLHATIILNRIISEIKTELEKYKLLKFNIYGPNTELNYLKIDPKEEYISKNLEKNGYKSNASFNIYTSEFDLISEITTLMLENGATMEAPHFFLSRDDDIQRQLKIDAALDGVAKAKELIEALGGKAGRIISITDRSGAPLGAADISFRHHRGDNTVWMPVKPSPVQLQTTVTVKVEIIQP